MMLPDDLASVRCRELPAAASARLDADAIARLTARLTGWRVEGKTLVRDFAFSNYPATIAFVNAVAAIAEAEDHHPELVVGYRRCRVAWTTHDAGGLTIRDFVCAARIDADATLR